MTAGREQKVIVGAGVAGVEAAAALRARDPSSRILLIGEEPYPFYARIRLGEVVAGRSDPGRLVLRNPDWYRQREIEFLPRTRVDAISVANARVHAADGEWIPYDRLLLATGARPFVPPIPGAGLDGVVSLRTMEDAVRLRDRARSAHSAVVIGGGLLGLEAAATLRVVGLAVTVIEAAPYLLPRQLDPAGAEVVLKMFRTRGIDFRFGAGVEAIVGTDRVQAVRLSRSAAIEDYPMAGAATRRDMKVGGPWGNPQPAREGGPLERSADRRERNAG